MNGTGSFFEIILQNSQKVYVGVENERLVIKTIDNEQIHLELDPIALPYLFKICLDQLNNLPVIKRTIHVPIGQTRQTIENFQEKFVITKKKLTYDRVFSILETNDKINPKIHSLDLSDDEWREIVLEAYRTRKTYAGAIIKNLQEVGLPIEDVQIGRVLKKMREEGLIRGTQRKSMKTGNIYFLLEFPPYKDDGL